MKLFKIQINALNQMCCFTALLLFSLNTIADVDSDNDGVDDERDNCVAIANPNQIDSNSDGFGNFCDGDLNNDGQTNTLDLNIYKLAHRSEHGDAAYHADADFNGDRKINTLDLNIYKSLHRKPPGPSGIHTKTLTVDTPWQIQLQGPVNTDYNVDLYDIDLFDSPETLINDLRLSGKIVICYLSAGTYENWRFDAHNFSESVKGRSLDDWPGERWLDIRSKNVKNIIQARLDLAKQKGCDGVEPDNVDGYTNNTGFNLTKLDQLKFNQFLANEAHKRGLLIGLKNNLEDISELVDYFDFALNEQCHEYNECQLLAPFIESGKPVFNIEYDEGYVTNPTNQNKLCNEAREKKFQTLVMPLDLDDSFRISCQL